MERKDEDMCNLHDYNLILNRIADAYRNVYGAELGNVLVYGSYARGDYDEYSDIDIVAIVKGERKTLQQLLRQVWDVSSDLEVEYGTIISPTVIPYDEFQQYKEVIPYYRNIMLEGVQVSA